MKVKIGNTIYSPTEQPIMLILTDSDKKNIANMAKDATKYVGYPDSANEDEVRKWMEVATN